MVFYYRNICLLSFDIHFDRSMHDKYKIISIKMTEIKNSKCSHISMEYDIENAFIFD